MRVHCDDHGRRDVEREREDDGENARLRSDAVAAPAALGAVDEDGVVVARGHK